MLGGAVGPVLGDDAEFTRLVRAVLRGSILLPGTHGERCLGEKGETWPFPGECVLVPWLLLEDVWGQHRGDLGLQAEQLGSVFPFYFAPLGETQPLLRRGVSSQMVLGDVLVLEVKTSGAAPL